MKWFNLVLFVLFPGLIIAQNKNSIQILGSVNGKIPEIIEYTLPIGGIDYFGFTDSVLPNSSGNFQINLKLNQTCFIDLSYKYRSYGTLIVEPGMTYKVHINTEDSKNPFTVESKNAKGQLLYNQIPNRSMIVGGHFELESKKYSKDSIPTVIKQKLEESRINELQGFKDLLKEKIISKDFYSLVETDRDYFYKGAQGSFAFINYLNEFQNKNTLNKTQYTELWSAIFKSNPITNPELLRSPWFYFYAENYLRYNELILDNINTAVLSELNKKGLIHTHNIDNAKKHLSGPQLEYYFAAYIYYEAINNNYEQELIKLFEEFKKEYPSSSYTHFLEPVIIPIISFHKKKEEPLNEKVKFVENTAEINSVKDLVKNLNGKPFYIDVWATWCGPCKDEFKDNPKLYELLKTKNITMVYISIDKDSKDKQWRDMAHFYNLEGYHIRANKKLDDDLRNIFGNQSLAIPWHFLVDENGTVINKKLSGGSQIQNLEKQLTENK